MHQNSLLSLWLALILLPSTRADRVAEGTVTPRGTDTSVEYKVVARKIPGTNKISYRMQLRAKEGGQNACFWVCSMLQFDLPAVGETSVPQVELRKDGGTDLGKPDGCWTCVTNGTVMKRPSVHFGCNRICLNDTAWHDAFNVPESTDIVFTTPTGSRQSVLDRDIASIYFDILQDDGPDCPKVSSCIANTANGQLNVNLTPVPHGTWLPGRHPWVNLWVGTVVGLMQHGQCFQTPEGSRANGDSALYCAVLRCEVGNWVTMDEPGDYRVRLTAEIFGASPGSRLHLTIPTQFSLAMIADIEGRAKVDQPFLIDSVSGMEYMTLEIGSSTPNVEGQTVRLVGEVRALESGARYNAGDLMYGISLGHVTDTTPPVIDRVAARRVSTQTGDVAHVRVTARDSFSEISNVSARLGTNAPVFLSHVNADSGVDLFEGNVGPLAGDTVVLAVSALDEGGNEATTTETLWLAELAAQLRGRDLVLTWNVLSAALESAATLSSPWISETGASSPFTVAVQPGARFFRLRRVGP